jgi:RNA polymerase sigma-70 factor (ECF subfamily)
VRCEDNEGERQLNYDHINELTRKASKGDLDALDLLCQSQMKTVMYHTLKALGNKSDAEDAAQDILAKMCRNISQLRDPEGFNVWLQRIIYTVCADFYRKKENRNAPKSLTGNEDFFIEENIANLPYESTEENETKRLLSRIVSELPEKRKQAVIMYYFDELTYKEIAEVMNCSISTVSTNLIRARETMKDALEKYTLKKKEEIMNQSDAKLLALLPLALQEEAETVVTNAEIKLLEQNLAVVLAEMQAATVQATGSIVARAGKFLALIVATSVIVAGGIKLRGK